MRISFCLLFIAMVIQTSLLSSKADEIGEAMALLRSDRPEVRYNAARTLRRFGKRAERAIPALVAMLSDSGIPSEFDVQYLEPRVNNAASRALVGIGRSAVPSLMTALTHEDDLVRIMAAQTLGELGPIAKDSLPALRKALADRDEWVRSDAAKAIGRIGIEPAIVVPVLNEVFENDKKDLVREAALEALFHADPSGKLAVPILLKGVDDSDAEVASTAIRTLGQYGRKAAPAVPRLIKALSSKDLRWDSFADIGFKVPVRRDAVRALGEIGSAADNAIRPLQQIMEQDENEVTRLWAAAAICRISPKQAVAKLAFKNLVDSEAIDALGSVGTKAAAHALIQILKVNDESELRLKHTAVVDALAEIGAPAAECVPLLRDYLKSKDPEDGLLKDAAIIALGKIGKASAEAIPDLERIMSRPGNDIEDWIQSDLAESAIDEIRKAQ